MYSKIHWCSLKDMPVDHLAEVGELRQTKDSTCGQDIIFIHLYTEIVLFIVYIYMFIFIDYINLIFYTCKKNGFEKEREKDLLLSAWHWQHEKVFGPFSLRNSTVCWVTVLARSFVVKVGLSIIRYVSFMLLLGNTVDCSCSRFCGLVGSEHLMHTHTYYKDLQGQTRT